MGSRELIEQWQKDASAEGSAPRRRRFPLRLLFLPVAVLVSAASILYRNGTFSLPLPLPASDLTSAEAAPSADAANLLAAPPEVARRWRFDAVAPVVDTPRVVDGHVYLAAGARSDEGRVAALDAGSGALVWDRPLGGVPIHAPVVAGDLLYVGVRGGRLLALDRHSGEERWSFTTRFDISGSPIVRDGLLYVGADALFALDAQTGAPRWQLALDGRVLWPMALSPAAEGSAGVLAAVDAGHNLALVEAGDPRRRGRLRLSFPLWFNPSGGPRFAGDRVLVAGERGSAQALERDAQARPLDRTVRFWWTRAWLYGSAPPPPLPRGYAWQLREPGGMARTLAADGDRFYVRVENGSQAARLLALDAQSGAPVWEIEVAAGSAPSATRLGRVLVVAAGRSVVALDAATGATLWELETDGRLAAAPHFDGTTMFVTLEQGRIEAFSLR